MLIRLCELRLNNSSKQFHFPLVYKNIPFRPLSLFAKRKTICKNLTCFPKRFEWALLKKTFRVLLTHLSLRKLIYASSVYEMKYFSSFSEMDFHPFLQILCLFLVSSPMNSQCFTALQMYTHFLGEKIVKYYDN